MKHETCGKNEIFVGNAFANYVLPKATGARFGEKAFSIDGDELPDMRAVFIGRGLGEIEYDRIMMARLSAIRAT